MAKRKTNVQLVKAMMEYSAYGPLAQAFIIQAIRQYAESVAASTPEKLETAMVSGAAWHGVAVEIKAQLDEFYGELPKQKPQTLAEMEAENQDGFKNP